MSIRMKCPHCGEVITAGDDKYGQQIECGACKAPVLVPEKPAGPVPRTASLLPDDAPSVLTGAGTRSGGSTGPAQPAQENDILETRPAWRAFPGHIAIAAILGVGGIIGAFSAGPYLLLGVPAAGVVLLQVWLTVLATKYRLTSQRLFWRQGILSRKLEEMEIYRITDVKLEQGAIESMLGVGTVLVLSSDATTKILSMPHLANPEQLKETLRTAYRAARSREGIRGAEFLVPGA